MIMCGTGVTEITNASERKKQRLAEKKLVSEQRSQQNVDLLKTKKSVFCVACIIRLPKL